MANKNSINAYHTSVKGERANAQNKMVLQCMRDIDQPTCIRMIHKVINAKGFEIDLVSLRRCVSYLSKPNPKGKWVNEWGRQMIKVAYDKECPITHITVGWYDVVKTQLGLFPQEANQQVAA